LRVNAIAKNAFENTNISITSNEFLCNVFESDIVLRIPITAGSSSHPGFGGPVQPGLGLSEVLYSQSNKKDLVLNIEVDGIHHRQEKKKRYVYDCIFMYVYMYVYII
jgi:hypothetical protein